VEQITDVVVAATGEQLWGRDARYDNIVIAGRPLRPPEETDGEPRTDGEMIPLAVVRAIRAGHTVLDIP